MEGKHRLFSQASLGESGGKDQRADLFGGFREDLELFPDPWHPEPCGRDEIEGKPLICIFKF